MSEGDAPKHHRQHLKKEQSGYNHRQTNRVSKCPLRVNLALIKDHDQAPRSLSLHPAQRHDQADHIAQHYAAQYEWTYPSEPVRVNYYQSRPHQTGDERDIARDYGSGRLPEPTGLPGGPFGGEVIPHLFRRG